jgi:hypothetical protein
LAAKKRRKNLQDKLFVEGKDEIGAGRENVWRRACKTVAASDVARDRQPLGRIDAPGTEGLIV